MIEALKATIAEMAVAGKGILAADESTPTMGKRLASIDVESTEENRRNFREMLFMTPGINAYINGVILFEETLFQKTSSGQAMPALLKELGIVPGIKVDKGLIPLGTGDEKVTQGLDGLPDRLARYKESGARFAKWRAVFTITDTLPSTLAITTNANMLARYASACQAQGIVPIVEPELLINGTHSIERCAVASEAVLTAVFAALAEYNVALEGIILKPSMVIAGDQADPQASSAQIAAETVKILRRTVPAAVPTINFLSGGQSDEFATENLNNINRQGQQPWLLSYSYGRALQAPCLKAWAGKASNVEAAQQALYKRAKLNSAAAMGEYQSESAA